MEYTIKLNEEQVKSLIEMIEQHRCEGESELCSDVRTSVKQQFQSQFEEQEEYIVITVDDVMEAAKKTLGPNYCDTCD